MFALLLACSSPSTVIEEPAPLADSGGTTDSGGDTAADSGDTAGQDTGAPPAPAACNLWGDPVRTGALVDESLDEVSGVAASVQNPGVLWLLEDHLGPAAFTAIDVEGNTLGTLTLDGAENEDWEAIALGACPWGTCLVAGDIGDNQGDRAPYTFYRVEEPVLEFSAEPFDLHVEPEIFPVTYPQGATNAEALALTADGRPFVVTKRPDLTGDLYLLDAWISDEVSVLRRLGSISTLFGEDEGGGAQVTSADLWPDDRHLLVRTYGRAFEYTLDLDAVGEGAPGDIVPFDGTVHVEAVSYDLNRRGYWQVPEGIGAPISFIPCIQ